MTVSGAALALVCLALTSTPSDATQTRPARGSAAPAGRRATEFAVTLILNTPPPDLAPFTQAVDRHLPPTSDGPAGGPRFHLPHRIIATLDTSPARTLVPQRGAAYAGWDAHGLHQVVAGTAVYELPCIGKLWVAHAAVTQSLVDRGRYIRLTVVPLDRRQRKLQEPRDPPIASRSHASAGKRLPPGPGDRRPGARP